MSEHGWAAGILIRILCRIGLIGGLLALWQFAPISRGTAFWLSRPSAILETLWSWIQDGSIWQHLSATLAVMTLGYVIGCIAGVACGFALGLLPRLHRIVSPFLTAFYALPKIALAPLFIILLGIGYAPKIALVAITVFFLLVNATVDGVRDVDRDMLQTLTLMGATRGEVIRKALIWAAMPWIFTAMRISVRYAFTNTLLAELIAANQGIGFLIQSTSGNFDSTGTYAAILMLVICSVALTEALSRIENATAKWKV
jgi:NitT/TauT family transport system permease protein